MSITALKNLLLNRSPPPRRSSSFTPPPSIPASTILPIYATYHSKPSSSSSHSSTTPPPSPVEKESSSSFPTFGRKSRITISPRLISDATIGLSDGLTVPFALTAGLSALGDTKTVIYGGLAELIAGAISMGLGGYLGARSEADSYKETQSLLTTQLLSSPNALQSALTEALAPLHLSESVLSQVTTLRRDNEEETVNFILKLQDNFSSPRPTAEVFLSALTIAAGYFFGGLLPLIPYFVVKKLTTALYVSVGVMAVALFLFGYVKTAAVVGFGTGERRGKCFVGGAQMVVVGGMAAGAAMGLVKGFAAVGVA
ncbi:VIT family-domain-containing protein [Podospora australis]|uniref:VIT family-domain-containing protein n=1 Tax=Podospora australis TaxID=1536484 RepID=A0AAN7ADD5_9PEZI|nr:VIT family-domain-containing protein [Podospora australis]